MAATRIWIKNPLAIFTANDLDASGGLVIEDGRIAEVLGAGQQPSTPCKQTFDAREHVLLPGLINTHHHFYQTLTRAWAPVVNQPLFPWLKTLYPVWARLTPEKLALASKVALAELLLSGCSTAADHHYLFPGGLENAIDVQVEAVRELGMRAMLTRGSMSLGEADGGLPPQQTVQQGEVILADSQRLIGQYHQRGDGAQIQIALAPCSPFSVTQEIMRQSAELAEELDVRLHTHLAETLDEEDFCLQRFGLRTVDYLDSVGWLGPRTWLAHGIHFNPDEITRLGAAGTGICHCPSSNMRLASGICPSVELKLPVRRWAWVSTARPQRYFEHDPRSAPGAVHPAPALRRRADHPATRTRLGKQGLGETAGAQRYRRAGGGQAGRPGAVQARRAAFLRQPRSALRAAVVRCRSYRSGDDRRQLAGHRWADRRAGCGAVDR